MQSDAILDRFSLAGRVCVVTGASGQLGTAFCSALGEAGATVVAADVNPKEGQEGVDVAAEESVAELFGRVAERHGRLDLLVNNAGVGVFTPLEDRTVEEIDRVHAVNVKGTILCTRAALGLLSEGSSVVNIASVYGVVSPDPRMYGDSGRNSAEIYGATKAGVVQLTRWFAAHLAPRGIRVNSITPGGVFAEQDPHFVENYERRTPLGRMAATGDLVGGLVYLASDAASYVTGHNLVIDGGLTAW